MRHPPPPHTGVTGLHGDVQSAAFDVEESPLEAERHRSLIPEQNYRLMNLRIFNLIFINRGRDFNPSHLFLRLSCRHIVPEAQTVFGPFFLFLHQLFNF